MDSVDLDNIYNIYSVANPDHHPRLMGRVVVTPSEITVLADYQDLFGKLEGSVTPRKMQHLSKWLHGSHTFGATLKEIKEGKYPELIPEAPMESVGDKAQPEDAENWFKVQRDDLKSPLVIKFKEGKAYMSDSDTPLDPNELNRLLELTRSGKATIRHHRPAEQMLNLMKALRKAEETEVDDGMSTHLFEDPMIQGVGNRKAYNDKSLAGGVYVMLNGNGTGAINRLHGHATGDAALRAMGSSIRGALDEVAGKEHKDVWRMVGDQFMVNLPTHEHAARFLRGLRSKLEAVPPIGGTHKLSMNAGLGSHPGRALMAIGEAKRASKDGNHLPGTAPGYAHSLVEGAEGLIATDPDQPVKP